MSPTGLQWRYVKSKPIKTMKTSPKRIIHFLKSTLLAGLKLVLFLWPAPAPLPAMDAPSDDCPAGFEPCKSDLIELFLMFCLFLKAQEKRVRPQAFLQQFNKKAFAQGCDIHRIFCFYSKFEHPRGSFMYRLFRCTKPRFHAVWITSFQPLWKDWFNSTCVHPENVNKQGERNTVFTRIYRHYSGKWAHNASGALFCSADPVALPITLSREHAPSRPSLPPLVSPPTSPPPYTSDSLFAKHPLVANTLLQTMLNIQHTSESITALTTQTRDRLLQTSMGGASVIEQDITQAAASIHRDAIALIYQATALNRITQTLLHAHAHAEQPTSVTGTHTTSQEACVTPWSRPLSPFHHPN